MDFSSVSHYWIHKLTDNDRTAQASRLLSCIREMPGSNLDRDRVYPEGFRGFPGSLHHIQGYYSIRPQFTVHKLSCDSTLHWQHC
jgi:hypothetical protein